MQKTDQREIDLQITEAMVRAKIEHEREVARQRSILLDRLSNT